MCANLEEFSPVQKFLSSNPVYTRSNSRSEWTCENLNGHIIDLNSVTSWTYLQWYNERWGAGVETQKNVRGEIGGWGRVPFNETYAPSLSTIYDGA